MKDDRNYITMQEIAGRLGLDKSNARKYAINNGFAWQKMRIAEGGNQLCNVLPIEEAEELIDLRRDQGFTKSKIAIAKNGNGFFYIVQIAPELDPLRVKLGFSTNPKRRLQAHRTIAPTAILINDWACKQVWEAAVIDSITRIDCTLIANEVYQCSDIDSLVQRSTRFFEIMPEVFHI